MGKGEIEFEFAIFVETFTDEDYTVPYYGYKNREGYFCSCRDWGLRRFRAMVHTSATFYYNTIDFLEVLFEEDGNLSGLLVMDFGGIGR